MTDADFARTLASALLPGGPLANGVVAPAAGEVLDSAELSGWIGGKAGAAESAEIREAGFASAGPDRQIEILRYVERRAPAPFQGLVAALHRLYYQHPGVIAAFGWRAAPPQPDGHVIPGTDAEDFAAVAARGPIWRDPGD